MTALARSILFFSAWVPAFVLLALRVGLGNRLLVFWLLSLSAIALAGLILLLIAFRRVTPIEMTVRHPENQSDQVMSFLLGYLLPFVVPDYSDTFTVIALTVFFGLLWILYVRGQVVVNPILLLAGWAIWKAEVSAPGSGTSEEVLLLVDSTDIRDGETLSVYQVDSPLRVATKQTARG